MLQPGQGGLARSHARSIAIAVPVDIALGPVDHDGQLNERGEPDHEADRTPEEDNPGVKEAPLREDQYEEEEPDQGQCAGGDLIWKEPFFLVHRLVGHWLAVETKGTGGGEGRGIPWDADCQGVLHRQKIRKYAQLNPGRAHQDERPPVEFQHGPFIFVGHLVRPDSTRFVF